MENTMINMALPKGRLGEKVCRILGLEEGWDADAGRKLVFEFPSVGIRFFWVKPSDVPIYVERGVADVGVAGKDILEEYSPDVYELSDLEIGRCRMAVATKTDFRDDPSKTLRVATKFSHVARRYYESQGRTIDIIKLNGSIELAPILGLSDVIVDIVETGATLKENGLEARETIFPISARLIANKASYRFKRDSVEALAAKLDEAKKENKK